MCGVAGFIGNGDGSEVARMTQRLIHRGPDAEGVFQDEKLGVYLGHRRLSVIDLESGDQPMRCGDLTIVFNGEIYNHAELRVALETRGCRFRSDHSDTEVLLHGYREYGEAFVDQLNGMWAFALWDGGKKRLWLSRDRFGKKPLYWFHRGGTFGFASELTALMEHPEAPREVSRRAMQKFFAYALIPAPHSLVEGIWKLPAGHQLVFEIGGTPRVSRYWRFEIEPEEAARTEDDLVEELRECLQRAVKRRLVADAPLGVFLSGGVDSSAVAALAARDMAGLKTFSLGFSEADFDESEQARQVASFLGTDHHCERLDLEKTAVLLPEIFARLDEPQGDNSLLPTFLLSGFARQQVTVALGGDGGDELFGGYETFRGLGKAEAYGNFVPRQMHQVLRALVSLLPVSHGNLSFDFRLKRGLRGASYAAPYWNAVWLGALEPAEIREYLGGPLEIEDLYSEAIETWESCRQSNLMDRTLQFYTEIYLQDGILPKVDRASMMHGLEVRSPLLDLEVANFARRLPHRFKVRNGITKYLLKKAVEPWLPAEIIQRKKMGFGTPVGVWFASGAMAPRSADPCVQKRLARHREGKSDERRFLWCQMSLEAWQEKLSAQLTPS